MMNHAVGLFLLWSFALVLVAPASHLPKFQFQEQANHTSNATEPAISPADGENQSSPIPPTGPAISPVGGNLSVPTVPSIPHFGTNVTDILETVGGKVIPIPNGNVSTPGEAAKKIGDSAKQVLGEVEDQYRKYSELTGNALMPVLGLIFLVAGFRIFHVTLAVCGFMFMAAIAYIFTTQATTVEFKYVLLICAVAGVVGAIITSCLVKVGLFLLGNYLGFWLCTLAFSVVIPIGEENYSLLRYINEPWQYYLVVAGCCLLFGALAVYSKSQKFIIVLTTSPGGSFVIMCFADIWAKTGFSDGVKTILSAARYQEGLFDVQLRDTAWGLVVGCLLLTAVGCRIQYWQPKKGPSKKPRQQAEMEMQSV
eukprot:NODE_104_length_1928_cov_357.821181_g74_i0.p1 GENE.NODE_104_length_1928_cov_357.821181_g74_i0~~NODE_104_length_1928_cov_357.821181_g74_i0.p1  ORF type:complete len:367 (-),score=92.65 NODE_104_length_1928_cov_357.821181_g74_i0:763-1863(-)